MPPPHDYCQWQNESFNHELHKAKDIPYYYGYTPDLGDEDIGHQAYSNSNINDIDDYDSDEYESSWHTMSSSRSTDDEDSLESGWLFDPLADAMQSQIAQEVKDLLQSWSNLYTDPGGTVPSDIDTAAAAKSVFQAAVQSRPDGAIFDYPIVVEFVTEMLTTDDLDQERKVAVVSAILSCEALSFTHLFCSPGGSATIRAMFVCAQKHSDCPVLQGCALQTLPLWAGQVSAVISRLCLLLACLLLRLLCPLYLCHIYALIR